MQHAVSETSLLNILINLSNLSALLSVFHANKEGELRLGSGLLFVIIRFTQTFGYLLVDILAYYQA